MKNFLIIITVSGLFRIRTNQTSKKAIKRTAMSEGQVIGTAKAQGYTESQIKAAIEKKKLESETDQTNEYAKENYDLEVDGTDEIPVVNEDISNDNGKIESKAQSGPQSLTYFG